MMMIIISSNILLKYLTLKFICMMPFIKTEMMQSRDDAIWSKTSSTPD